MSDLLVKVTQVSETRSKISVVGLQGPQGEGIAEHEAKTAAAHAASAISFTPAGTLASTDVQAALAEAAAEVVAEAEARMAAVAQEAADRLAAIAAHAADETDVHGIPDTSALVLDTDGRLSDPRPPTGPAGGDLAGTYPNPTLAFDPATQAELDAHGARTTDAHGGIVAATDPRLSDERVPVDGSVTLAKLGFDPATQAELNAEAAARQAADDAEAAARQAADALLIPLDQKAAALGVATLNASGKIPADQIPAIAITDTHVVGSQEAMLALAAERGDVAVRTDVNRSFILDGDDPTVLSNWQELLSPVVPGAGVTSVDGRTGAVDLSDRYTPLAHQDLTTAAHGGIVAATDARLTDQRVPTDGSVTNAKVATNAAIAKSKLAPLAIADADVAAGAAIAKSKLAPLAIADADVAAGAAIAKSKLAPLAIADADVAAGAAIAKSKLAPLAIVDADVSAGAAIAKAKLAALNIGNADVAAGAGILESKLALDVATGLLIPKSLVTAAGQLIGSTASGTPAAIPAPTTEGHVLTAALADARKMAWAAPTGGGGGGAGGLVKIAEVVVGAGGQATIEFANIPQIYRHLQLKVVGRYSGAAATNVNLIMNGLTTAIYDTAYQDTNGTTLTGLASNGNTSLLNVMAINGTDAPASQAAVALIDIPFYARTNWFKTVASRYQFWQSSASPVRNRDMHGLMRSAAAITSLTLSLGSGSFAENTVAALYGYEEGAGSAPGVWSTYTPGLFAATTNPTLGTGSVVEGRYYQHGSIVHVSGRILFGTSGVSAGSGAYEITLPAAPRAGLVLNGSGYLYDNSVNDVRAIHLVPVPGQPLRVFPRTGAGTNYSTGHATPWAWAANDSINWAASYEVA